MHWHISASRLHELSSGAIILDSEELLHLKVCTNCEALLRRFIERLHDLQTQLEEPEDRQKSA